MGEGKARLPAPAGRCPAVSDHDKNQLGSALQAPKYCPLFISICLQTDLRGGDPHFTKKKKPAQRGEEVRMEKVPDILVAAGFAVDMWSSLCPSKQS